jgi:hypothetical protein
VEAKLVEREDVRVVFVRTTDDLHGMQRAWARLEAAVGTRGRKFFGAFDPGTREYRACAEMREGDDPAALGLESGTLSGGRYRRARIRGEPPAIYEQIGPTFHSLAQSAEADSTRPSIEVYRRRDQIDLLLPVV